MKRDKKITSVVPVLKDNDHNPYRCKKITNGFLYNFFDYKKNVPSNRQQLPASYFLAHNFWLVKTASIIENNGEKPWSFLGKNVKPLVIENSIDIHTEIDLDTAKRILRLRKIYF